MNSHVKGKLLCYAVLNLFIFAQDSEASHNAAVEALRRARQARTVEQVNEEFLGPSKVFLNDSMLQIPL